MLGLTLHTSVAAGDEARCTSTRVESVELTAPWRDAVAALHEELATWHDCIPSTLKVTSTPHGVRVTLTTADGRHAERSVTTPAALSAVARGLVATIPPDVAAPNPTPPEETAPRAGTPDAPAPAPPPEPLKPPPLSARPVRVAVGAMLDARVGMPTQVFVPDVELRADVLVDAWFLLAAVRYAPVGVSFVRPTIPGYAYDEVVVAIGAGRRFGAPPVVLDASLATALAVMTEEGDLPDGTGGTTSGARLAASARALFGRARWRFAAALHLEVAPIGGAPQVDPKLPSLPSWSFGAGMGIVGDVL